MDPSIPLIVQLPGLIVVIIAMSYGANYFLARVFHGRTFRYLAAPGIIVHEYSHAVACILTGARIRQVRVFDSQGGAVVHEAPRLPFGQALVSLAPIPGAIISTWLLAALLVPDLTQGDLAVIVSWKFLVFAYLAAAITVCMAPSRTDVRTGMAALAGLCAVGLLLSFSPVAALYLEYLLGDAGESALLLVYLSVGMLSAILILAAAAYFLLHRTVRQGVRYKTFE